MQIEEGMEMISARQARLEHDFEVVIASQLQRGGTDRGLPIQIAFGSNENGPRRGDVEIGRIGFWHAARPVLGDMKFAGDDQLIVDVQFLLRPLDIVPLDGAHTDERLQRLFAVGRRAVWDKRHAACA